MSCKTCLFCLFVTILVFLIINFRNVHQEINQQRNEHHIQIQKHEEAQKHHEEMRQQQNSHHVSDESDGHDHTHPKLDIKNFHTQLW